MSNTQDTSANTGATGQAPEAFREDTAFQVRDGIHSPEVLRLSTAETHVVDFGGIYSPSLKDRQAVGQAFREAFTGPGYLVLKNHQFPQSVITRARAAMEGFFSLSVEDKMKCHYLDWPNHRGYVPLEGINADHSLMGGDMSEAIEMAEDLPADDPDHLRGIRFYGPNNWPMSPADFRWALGTYYDCQIELGRHIMRAFEYALETDEGFFTSKYTKPLSRTRVCHYPPQGAPVPSQEDAPEGAASPASASGPDGDIDMTHIGIGAHTDYECFTTVWQDAEGLQMLGADGRWRMVPAMEGAFAVNLGDLMQIWTNDQFKSTLHRVINTSGRDRYSLVQFFGVDYDIDVEPLRGTVSPDNPWRYEPIKAGQHSENMVAATYHYDEE